MVYLIKNNFGRDPFKKSYDFKIPPESELFTEQYNEDLELRRKFRGANLPSTASLSQWHGREKRKRTIATLTK